MRTNANVAACISTCIKISFFAQNFTQGNICFNNKTLIPKSRERCLVPKTIFLWLNQILSLEHNSITMRFLVKDTKSGKPVITDDGPGSRSQKDTTPCEPGRCLDLCSRDQT